MVTDVPASTHCQPPGRRGGGDILQPIWEDVDQEVIAPNRICQKADETIWVDLWMPKLPSLTERVAWTQVE